MRSKAHLEPEDCGDVAHESLIVAGSGDGEAVEASPRLQGHHVQLEHGAVRTREYSQWFMGSRLVNQYYYIDRQSLNQSQDKAGKYQNIISSF